MTATTTKPAIALYDHQKTGVKWLLGSRNRVANGNRQRGGILADEMGLGKTLVALLAAKAHQTIDPDCKVIVIAPKSLIINWKQEAAKAGVKLDLVCSNHAASFPEGIKGKFVVINDESHSLQNLDSARTKQFLSLVRGVKTVQCTEKNDENQVVRRWEEDVPTGDECQAAYLLTGTPIKNGRPLNLLPLLIAINHGLVDTKAKVWDYKNRYCGPERVATPKGFVTTFNGATNLGELHGLIQPSILRRLTKDCLDLPELTRVLRTVDLSAEAAAVYDAKLAELKAEYLKRLTEGKIQRGGEALVLLTQLRRAGSLAKVQPAIDLADEVLEQSGSVVIFTEFRESAERIAAHYGVNAYTGETSAAERNAIVERFQAGTQTVFVGIGKAGGVGLTLHAHGKCRNVILVDRPWTPGDAEQEEKRAHRIGQPNAVLATWLQHGAVDETVDAILSDKKENSEHVLAGTRNALRFKTEAEIAEAVYNALGW